MNCRLSDLATYGNTTGPASLPDSLDSIPWGTPGYPREGQIDRLPGESDNDYFARADNYKRLLIESEGGTFDPIEDSADPNLNATIIPEIIPTTETPPPESPEKKYFGLTKNQLLIGGGVIALIMVLK